MTTSYVSLKHEDNLEAGTPIGMFFDVGPVENTAYGSAEKMSGVMPLLLPYGEYIQPPLLDDKDRFDKLVREVSTEYASCFPNDLDEDIRKKVLNALAAGAQVQPVLDLSTDYGKPFLALTVSSFAMDDVMDSLGEDATLKYADAKRVMAFLKDLFNGQYKSPDEIPSPVEALLAYHAVMWKFAHLGQVHIPNFTSKNKGFVDELNDSVRAHILLMQSEYVDYFSRTTRLFLGGHNNGILCFVEYAAMQQGIQLSDEVRQDYFFKRFREVAGLAGQAANDIYGVARDIKLNQVKDSNILTSVKFGGVPLQKAFDRAVRTCVESLNDCKILAILLREYYADDENILKYIRCLEEGVDGSIYFYARATRYGETNSKVVKLI